MNPTPGPESDEDELEDTDADLEAEDTELDVEEEIVEISEDDPVPELKYRQKVFQKVRHHLDYSAFALAIMAIPVGVLAAYGSWTFLSAFGLLGDWLFTEDLGLSTRVPKLFVLILGGLFFGWVLQRLKWERFRTPAHVIIAASEREGRIPLKDGIITAIADALSLGLGAPVGRYGPAIHLGATIGSIIAQWFHLGKTSIRILLGCGVAAAISASFNAPIAGVIFAHEVIIGHFRLRAFAPITLASVAAVAISKFHAYDYVTLKLWSEPRVLDLWDYPVFLILGIVAAGVALIYMHGIVKVNWFAQKSRLPLWLQPAIGAGIAGLVGLGLPQIIGLGDQTMQGILEQDSAAPHTGISLLILLGLGKLVASIACLGFRMPGGSFSPAIFVGSTLGALAGLSISFIDYQIAVLVGMGAMVSCVMGAPLATILIVFELTENYQAATAVMVGVVASNALVTRYYARSLFHRQIRMWGIDIGRPEEKRTMQAMRVDDIMTDKYIAVRPDRTVAELRKLVDHGYRSELFVIDDERKLLGQMCLTDLVIADETETAGELAEYPKIILKETDSVWSGFEDLEDYEGVSVPVVNNEEEKLLVGAVYTSVFVKTYRQSIQDTRENEKSHV